MLPWIMDLWIYCDILLYLVAWLPQRPSSAEIVDATIASIVIFTMRCTTANDHNRTGNADHDIPFTCGLELILYVYAPLAVIICLFFGNYNSKFKKNPKISKIFKIFKYSQNFHWPGVYNIKHNLVRSCFQFWLSKSALCVTKFREKKNVFFSQNFVTLVADFGPKHDLTRSCFILITFFLCEFAENKMADPTWRKT